MSYIDALHDTTTDTIHVVERVDGQRVYKEYPATWTFYYEDPRGKHRSMFGTPVSRFTTRKRSEFNKERRIQGKKRTYESDINPVFRTLSEHYLGVEAPQLHTCFFDIEVDFDPARGFARPSEPFNPITAVSLYLDWLDQLITLAIPPKSLSIETARELTAHIPNLLLCETETELLEAFFQLIEDCDVITGWNSESYDIPYMVNRTTMVLSKDDTRKFCLWGQLPRRRTYERFGKEEETYDLVGRVHVDYLQLYKKYNYESRHSYKLDSIGELEVGENKTQYEGTLDQLYNRDFVRFLEYNRQDTMLLYKIHAKLKFLELANQLAHENTVLFPTVMGSVAMIEMAIYNEAHSRGVVVPDKNRKEESDEESKTAAGAYVATPKTGIHEWVGAVDINSLYPSVIRALNFAPETIVGQIRPTYTDRYLEQRRRYLDLGKRARRSYKAEDGEDIEGNLAWDGMFACLEYDSVMAQERGTMLTVDWEDGRSEEMSAAQLWRAIYDSGRPWILTANGTIFTYESEGIIPGLLSKWYSERKEIQKKLKAATTKEEIEYYDKRQLVRKILLNSTYGALLNEHCKFYDVRIGQSVTLCGRQIVRHMMSHINETVTGQYKHDGDAIVYGDTDSCYFSAYTVLKDNIVSGQLEWDKETVIRLYDSIADEVNNSFPAFMERAFHAPRERGAIIRAGRELVGDRALFIKKKKYAINIYDKEGKRKDVDGPGVIKAMGLDLKRSDTPKYVQEFLSDVLRALLDGAQREQIVEKIVAFKNVMATKQPWEKGSPRAVNGLTRYVTAEERSKTGKVNMPGHIRAAANWNTLRRLYGDNYSMQITDGMKIVVCKLLPNAMDYTSVAYPVDELRLPQWFKDLPFDVTGMETLLVDQKIDNLIGELGWDIRQSTDRTTTFNDLFTFE